MSAYPSLRRSRPRWAIAAAVTAAALGIGASPALAGTGTGVVSSFTVTPASLAAGSSPNIVADMQFSYGTSTTDSVKSIDVVLPKGLWASLAAAPSGTTVGSGTITLAHILGDGTTTSAAIPATVTTDAIPSGAPATALTGIAVTSPLSTAVTAVSQGYIVLDPSGPNLEMVFPNVPDSTAGGAITFQESEINLTLEGTVTPAGSTSTASFTRLPSTSTAATSSLSVTTYGSATGAATDAFTPTGPPAFSPTVSSVGVNVLNAADNATVSVNIAQAAGQGGIAGNSLTLPSSVLSFNANAATDVTAAGTQVGTATLITPLLSTPVAGTFTISGSLLAPVATVAFPSFGISFKGTITNPLTTPTVTFSGIPDVPFTLLNITLTGGTSGLFNATCNGQAGSVASSFTSQWSSSLTYTPPATTVTETGCAKTTTPVTTTPTTTTPTTTSAAKPTTTPTLSGVTLGDLAKGDPRLVFTAVKAKAGTKITTITISLPSGISFVKKELAKNTKLTGAKLKSEKLSGGRLIITLKSAVSKVKVTIGTKALAETKTLKSKIAKHKVKSLTFGVTAKTGNSNVKQVLKVAKLT